MAEDLEYILIITGPQGNTFEHSLGASTSLGRQTGNDIQLADQRVSRQHARIDCNDEGCTLTDLNSSNGTHLNGERIHPQVPVPLEPGAKIGIGPFSIILDAVPVEVEVQVKEAPAPEPPEGHKAQTSDEAQSAEKEEERSIEPEPSGEPGDEEAEEAPKREMKAPPPAPPAPPEPPQAKAEIPDLPPGLSQRSRRFLEHLPGIYHTDFMARFLGIFEGILTPIEWEITHFDMFLSPGTAPGDFLPWLANWFDLTFDDSWSEAQRRSLLAEAHRIYARRGTRWALSRVLEIYTGHAPTVIDTDSSLDPFTFRVILPASTRGEQELIEQLIDAHKPAHTTYTLEFSG